MSDILYNPDQPLAIIEGTDSIIKLFEDAISDMMPDVLVRIQQRCALLEVQLEQARRDATSAYSTATEANQSLESLQGQLLAAGLAIGAPGPSFRLILGHDHDILLASDFIYQQTSSEMAAEPTAIHLEDLDLENVFKGDQFLETPAGFAEQQLDPTSSSMDTISWAELEIPGSRQTSPISTSTDFKPDSTPSDYCIGDYYDQSPLSRSPSPPPADPTVRWARIRELGFDLPIKPLRVQVPDLLRKRRLPPIPRITDDVLTIVHEYLTDAPGA